MSADLSYFALFLAGLTVLGLALAPWMARVFDGRVTLFAPSDCARLIVKVGSALLVDRAAGLKRDWLEAIAAETSPSTELARAA